MPAIVADRIGKVTTTLGADALLLVGMTATERLSELFTIELDVLSRDVAVDLHALLGTMASVQFDGAEHVSRHFHGMVCEYTELGRLEDSNDFSYRLLLRPTQYLKTLNRWSIIYSKKSMTDLITTLAGDARETSLTATYPALDYRVQYDESDFDFLSRHLEREGIYYYFKHDAAQHQIVLVDAPAAHAAMTPASVRLGSGAKSAVDDGALLWSLQEHRRIAPTGYAVDDYDYTSPTTALKKQKALAHRGKRPARFAADAPADVNGTVAERVEHPGNYTQPQLSMGERYAAVRLDADRAGMARSHAGGNLFAAAVGRKLTVAFDESDANFTFQADADYLIVGTRHVYKVAGYRSGKMGDEDLRVELELMPVAHPFRPPQVTPMPRIRGPQTGVVVGPEGEEIYTDKYGRIKVKFHWDTRTYEGATSPEPRSIWLRVAQMSAGNGFGAFMVPRVGHEVIVEFLNGDPDRPIVTGSVYNETNLPAFGTAAGNPVQGLRTNSSKGGGGFNEIRLDDTKDSEVFSVQAQKDLKTLVLKGDETRDIKEGSRTTTIAKGDETLTVTQGKRTTTIKADETTTIQSGNLVHKVEQGDATHTVAVGKRTTEINGDDTLTVKTGNREATIQTGNEALTVSVGNISVKVDLGKHATEAMQSIEMKVGANSIKIDQSGVTIKGLMVKVEASTMMDLKASAMMQIDGGGMMMAKAGIVMIN